MFEVELKFRVTDFVGVQAKVAELGASLGDECWQVDQYFAHPARDFGVTDEALRIRRDGDAFCLTYKGPKLDRTTKTRREIELALSGESAQKMQEVFLALGFQPVAEVAKRRRQVKLEWKGKELTVTLDTVLTVPPDCGSDEIPRELGRFIEIETLAGEPQAPLEAAKALVHDLALRFGLAATDQEFRSYLELSLAARGAGAADGRPPAQTP